MLWLLAIMLAQLDGFWVDFEICQIDRSSMPHVARRTRPPELMSIWVTNERKPGLFDIYPKPEGLACTHIVYLGNAIYVVGTRAQVKRKLDGN